MTSTWLDRVLDPEAKSEPPEPPAGRAPEIDHALVKDLRAEYRRLLACDAWCGARTSERELVAGRVTYLGDKRYSAAEVAERDAARPGMWLALSERMEAAGVSIEELG